VAEVAAERLPDDAGRWARPRCPPLAVSIVISRSFEEAPASELAADYLASEAHYLSIAGRILAASRGAASFVLVTGDPTAEPQPLSQALRKLAGPRQGVIAMPCGPELKSEDLCRASAVVATLPAAGGTAALSETKETSSPLFIFEEVDRLSDRQIEEICATIRRGPVQSAAGVLLAPPEFLSRLERPCLQLLREETVVRLRFDQIGDDETIDFLRHQLATRESED
jgi:hypothetical protein